MNPAPTPPRSIPWQYVAGLVLGVLVATACGGRSTAPQVISHRLIESEPQVLLEPDSIWPRTPVREWVFSEPADLEKWSLQGLQPKRGGADGLILLVGKQPHASIHVDLEADSIDAFDLDISIRRDARIRLLWTAEGKEFSGRRSVRFFRKGTRWTSRVGDHPDWTGRISNFRIVFRGTPSRRIVLRRLVGISLSGDSERLARNLDQAWKVDLGNEVRDALPAPPGLTRTWDVTPGPDALLELAYGVGSNIGGAVGFRVRASTPAGEHRTLFDHEVDPATQEREGIWLRARIDLSPYVDKAIRLTFETTSSDALRLDEGLPFWASPVILGPSASPELPNVILISVDTLRADHLSLYGYDRQTSPRIDAWARSSATVFENTVAPAPWTLPSHVSLFSGRDALSHGVNYDMATPSAITTVAELLRKAGYATHAITGGGMLHPRYAFFQGFDVYRYWSRGRLGSEAEIAEGVDRAIEWLQHEDRRPFFLFFHTYEVHSPFRPRQPYFGEFLPGVAPPDGHFSTLPNDATEEDGFIYTNRWVVSSDDDPDTKRAVPPTDLPNVIAAYDAGIAHTDAHLGRLFDVLRASRLDSSTVVVLTSDHGEAFGEKGLASHSSLYDFDVMVPLVIALPGQARAGQRLDQQVRLIDVAPTILELAGLQPPAETSGASLVPLMHGTNSEFPDEAWSYAASSNRGVSVRSGNQLKYIYNHTAWDPAHGQEELYRLDADPSEEHNLALESIQTSDPGERTIERLADMNSGLEIRVRNQGRSPLNGSVSGPGVSLYRVKSIGHEASKITWKRKQTAGFTVPPAESLLLVLETVEAGTLTVSGGFGHPGRDALSTPFELEVDVLGLHEPRTLRLRGQTWVETAPDEEFPVATEIRVSLRGELENVPPPAPEVDDALREQLEALGYIQ